MKSEQELEELPEENSLEKDLNFLLEATLRMEYQLKVVLERSEE